MTDDFTPPSLPAGALPPGQQLASAGKWPQVGEPAPVDLPPRPQLVVSGACDRPQSFDAERLLALGPVERLVDVHCVTRWSKPAMRFFGVPLATVLHLVGPRPEARFVRFIAHGRRSHDTSLPLDDALRLGTLLAWEVDGAALPIEHGGPLRAITPGRYFYKSLKWLREIELLERDRLGYWEREAGYHNTADPDLEQRYMAPTLTRLQVREALRSRTFAGRELRSIDCRGHDLTGLDARRALLRDADFRGCPLAGARFDEANLSNARFAGADLRGASFASADVEGADFTAADLRGADFRGASLFGASFTAPGGERPARFDAATRFDPAGLAALMPEQERFVRDGVFSV